MKPISFIIGMLLALTGCMSIGPDYKSPKTSLSPSWSSPLTNGVTAQPVKPIVLARWWEVLSDATLTNLIERTRTGNRDLRQAEARLREARAQCGVTKADLFPTLSANASGSRTRSSESTGGGTTGNHFANSFDASWELDVFGGKRRALEAATATVQASEEELRDVLVSLFAEVALNYVEMRSYQTRLAITEASLKAQTETYEITEWRREAGLTTQLDVNQARQSLETTRAQIPSLRTGLEQAKHQLAILTGQPPGALNTLLAETKPVPVTPAEVAVGVPADTLRQRPDVRRAERKLAAQTAQIGVAEAERYPKLTLAGSIGLEALEYGNLYTASARTAQGLVNAAWKLFDGGRIRQQVAVETARQEELLSAYEAAVLTALKDIENALVAYANEQNRRQALAEAVKSGQSAFDLARQQYAAGLVDFQTVLDTQRSLLSVQEQLAISDAEVTSNLIRLYKALGGGWTSGKTS
jgi:NodT family efflux transporter outer membrane factor (OMF) lipoprotein